MDERFEDRYERMEMNAARLAEEQAARGALPCPDCGSADGMQWYSREGVLFVYQKWPEGLIPLVWYQVKGDDHCMYAPCRTCNPFGVIPEGYEPVELASLDEWLESECMCPDCVRERSN